MTGRTQSICIDGKRSPLQGLRTIVSFIDDNTYSVAKEDAQELSQVLTDNYEKISDYMMANRLVINDKKTHLMVFCKKSLINERINVSFKAGEHVIVSSKTEKLLGARLDQSLRWNAHIVDNEMSLVKQLNSRVNGLSIVARSASFKSRLMIANGIIIGKICNLIQLWGGASDFLIKSLQKIQNKAGRVVTRKPWFTPTRLILKQCNWLAIKQLVQYHIILSTHKMLKSGKPRYFFEKFSSNHDHNTRTAVRFGENFSAKSTLASNSFCYKGAVFYNKLPQEVTEAGSIQVFKRRLKSWIQANVKLD